MAGTTGLEPATSAVTGQRSDQLSYVPTGLLRFAASDQTFVVWEAAGRQCGMGCYAVRFQWTNIAATFMSVAEKDGFAVLRGAGIFSAPVPFCGFLPAG